MPQTTPTATPTVTPNLYHLSGHHLHVTYATTGTAGQPTLTYQDLHHSMSFRGNQIRTAESDIGMLISVALRVMPDVGSTLFSLLIPRMRIHPTSVAPVHTYGITTVHSTPFAVPESIQGQLDTYTVASLQGTAQAVVF